MAVFGRILLWILMLLLVLLLIAVVRALGMEQITAAKKKEEEAVPEISAETVVYRYEPKKPDFRIVPLGSHRWSVESQKVSRLADAVDFNKEDETYRFGMNRIPAPARPMCCWRNTRMPSSPATKAAAASFRLRRRAITAIPMRRSRPSAAGIHSWYVPTALIRISRWCCS